MGVGNAWPVTFIEGRRCIQKCDLLWCSIFRAEAKRMCTHKSPSFVIAVTCFWTYRKYRVFHNLVILFDEKKVNKNNKGDLFCV
jgi:hypothetical protein